MGDPHEWQVHGERLIDDTPHIRVSLADIELPNHVTFTQYVFRMRRVAMMAVLDDAGEQVLLLRRHRFIVHRWVWELPGGYVDDDEDPAAAAAREAEEETGWRPRNVDFVLSCQPLIGNADYPQDPPGGRLRLRRTVPGRLGTSRFANHNLVRSGPFRLENLAIADIAGNYGHLVVMAQRAVDGKAVNQDGDPCPVTVISARSHGFELGGPY